MGLLNRPPAPVRSDFGPDEEGIVTEINEVCVTNRVPVSSDFGPDEEGIVTI